MGEEELGLSWCVNVKMRTSQGLQDQVIYGVQ